MKRYLYFLLLLVTSLGFSQANMLFLERNYTEALNEAKAKKKPLVVMFYAHWCDHCKKMKTTVLQDTDVVLAYAQNYITIGVDAESEAGNKLKNKFSKLIIDNKLRNTFFLLLYNNILIYLSFQ
jgi:thioredoxin-related protein